MDNDMKIGESNVPGNETPKRRPEQETSCLPEAGQAHSEGRRSAHRHRAGLLAFVELGGGTALYISAFDILAGPWRSTSDNVPGQYLHVRSPKKAQKCL